MKHFLARRIKTDGCLRLQGFEKVHLVFQVEEGKVIPSAYLSGGVFCDTQVRRSTDVFALSANFNPLTHPVVACSGSMMLTVLLERSVNVLFFRGCQFDRALDCDVQERENSSQRLANLHVTRGRKGGEGDEEASSV